MKKYKVTQRFMDELNTWNNSHKYPDGTTIINQLTLNELPEDVTEWMFEIWTNVAEGNRRFGAVINWINGEDVFEVDTPSYIVKVNGDNGYLNVEDYNPFSIVSDKRNATVFYRLEDAKEYENAIFEAVELDE